MEGPDHDPPNDLDPQLAPRSLAPSPAAERYVHDTSTGNVIVRAVMRDAVMLDQDEIAPQWLAMGRAAHSTIDQEVEARTRAILAMTGRDGAIDPEAVERRYLPRPRTAADVAFRDFGKLHLLRGIDRTRFLRRFVIPALVIHHLHGVLQFRHPLFQNFLLAPEHGKAQIEGRCGSGFAPFKILPAERL